tara:strand:+ start:540 stop:731 length:192 start_codon:yes stop_codon:yes gene_type:complete
MKYFKCSIKEKKSNIDYDKSVPFDFETIEILNSIKYRIIHFVKGGVGDSRIITYKVIKTGEVN